MDLANLDTKTAMEKGAVLQLRHPATNELLFADDAKKKPMTITLMGIDGETFSKIRRENQRKLSKANKSFNPEDADEQGLDTLAALTKDWANLVLGGKPLEFSRDNARKLYSDYPWIRELVNEFCSLRENFIKA